MTAFLSWLDLALLTALPTIGLAAGPTYAPIVYLLALRLAVGALAASPSPLMGRAARSAGGVRAAETVIDPHPSLRATLPAGGRDILPEARVLDRTLMALALAFAAWAAASACWSVVPGHSLAGTAQWSGIMLAVLVVLSVEPGPMPPRTGAILAGAALAGPLIVLADEALGFPLHGLIPLGGHDWQPTKYNRGIDYLMILIWPILAETERRAGRTAALAVALPALALAFAGYSSSARAEAVLGGLVFLWARWRPAAPVRTLAIVVPALALALPLLLRLAVGARSALGPYVKGSFVHRLEIWDYQSARILDRPLSGSGFWSATAIPATEAERARDLYLDGGPIYPHNQWLELWLETGLVGVLIGVGAVLVVLGRVRGLAAGARAYAVAAIVSALVLASVNFELTTDSWWAALAATGFLFRLWHGDLQSPARIS